MVVDMLHKVVLEEKVKEKVVVDKLHKVVLEEKVGK